MQDLDRLLVDKSENVDGLYHIDMINGKNFDEGITVQDLESSNEATFNGWAIDAKNKENPSTVLLRCGNEYYAALMQSSEGIDAYFGGEGYYNNAYFTVSCPLQKLAENNYSFDLYVISAHKDSYYKISGYFE